MSVLKQYYLLLFIGLPLTLSAQTDIASDFATQRQTMVQNQISARGIRAQPVLNAIRKVERHRFVPAEYRRFAYMDRPLPIGEGQTISQPYIVALMTELLELHPTDKVLEIGTGSGYQAAILAEICDSVFTIEIIPRLAQRAKGLLENLGYDNIRCQTGDGYRGWPEHAPFDAIIVTCAPTQVPKPLEAQLIEGGRMIIPVGQPSAQELVLLIKQNGKLIRKSVIPVRFVPMLKSDGGVY